MLDISKSELNLKKIEVNTESDYKSNYTVIFESNNSGG